MVFHKSDLSMEASTQSSLLCGMLCTPKKLDFRDDDEELHACSVTDQIGILPLHDAIARFPMDCLSGLKDQSSLELHIQHLINCLPTAIRTFDDRGFAPIHVACEEGASLAVIHALVQAWPDSVKATTKNKHQMLPLHLVCRYYSGRASEKCRILRYLLRAFPASIEIPTSTGDLALHLTCRNYFCTLPVMDLLVQAYPDAVRTVNNKNELPLHVACSHHYMRRYTKIMKQSKKIKESNSEDDENSCTSRDIIQYLVTIYPDGVQVFDLRGNLPLHAAVRGDQSPDTIQFLIDICPHAIEYPDHAGRMALHLAVSRPIPCVRSIEILLAANPAAALAADSRNKLPKDYAQNKAGLRLALEGMISKTENRDLC